MSVARPKSSHRGQYTLNTGKFPQLFWVRMMTELMYVCMSPVKNEFLDGLVSVFVLLFCGYIVSVQGWISFRRETHKLFRFLQ